MTGFFDPEPSPGSNRHAEQTDCPTCQGHRLVPVETEDQADFIYDLEIYARCPDCNPAPTAARQPVEDARWKTYDR